MQDRVHVSEVLEIPLTEIVNRSIACFRGKESVLRALSSALAEHWTCCALRWQGVFLRLAKGALGLAAHKVAKVGVQDVAEQVLFVNEVITAIEVTIVFKRNCIATGLGKNAHSSRCANEGRQRSIDHRDVDLANVVAKPLVEHRGEK